MHLDPVRERITAWLASLHDRAAGPGAYRCGPGRRCDLYSSVDAALMRAIMGEDLSALPAAERAAWCEHIDSFAERSFERCPDGMYGDRFGHSAAHANGQVIGALGLLGGRQAAGPALYRAFAAPEQATAWLDALDWSAAWRQSHWFWGGIHCYSASAACTPAWRSAVFAWLDANCDPADGLWRRGTAPADRHQRLGGGAHILPMYLHQDRPHPHPRGLIDHVLGLQLADGTWLRRAGWDADRPRSAHPAVWRGAGPELRMHYLELDALWALAFARRQEPGHRAEEVHAAVRRYGAVAEAAWNEGADAILAMHPHWVLAAVGTFGLLHQLDPEAFPASTAWSDIFSDHRLYRTRSVESAP